MRTINIVFCDPSFVYSFLVVSWKNTLFLGIDACFKLKLKDRGFKDPDLGTNLVYMVNNRDYAKHLSDTSTDDHAETVSIRPPCHPVVLILMLRNRFPRVVLTSMLLMMPM
jgi:hypothetical protein